MTNNQSFVGKKIGYSSFIIDYLLSSLRHSRIAFRFDRSTLPLAAFAEDYTLTATGSGSCELAWTYAYEWGGPLPGLLGWVFGRFFCLERKKSVG